MRQSKQQYMLKVGLCSINSTAMAFKENGLRVLASICAAKAKGCTLRVGSELEVSGHGCQDSFLEYDTALHCMQMLQLIVQNMPAGIVACVGLPVYHKIALYNCVAVVGQRQVFGLKAKTKLCNQVNYYEARHFTAWDSQDQFFVFPRGLAQLTGKRGCPIGNFLMQFGDTTLGFQTCEEGWQELSVATGLRYSGAEVIINHSASHYCVNKFRNKVEMFRQQNAKLGGVYLYCNSLGSDAGRLYFDGRSFVLVNNRVVAVTEPHSLEPSQMLVSTADLKQVRHYRTMRKYQRKGPNIQSIEVDWRLTQEAKMQLANNLTLEDEPLTFELSCYLFDYLVKSRARGFLLPLSGGVDSAATALVVFNLARLLTRKLPDSKYLQELAGQRGWLNKSAKEICKTLLHTVYLPSEFSSSQTRKRASELAAEIGSTHHEVEIGAVYEQLKGVAEKECGRAIKFDSEGGSAGEDLALQNLQARIRMVMSYLLAQTAPEQGCLLVLGSSNLDQYNMGYFTKYDCSSADLNPISSLHKEDLQQYLRWNLAQGVTSVASFLAAVPTAELKPGAQADEADMGLSYAEIVVFGKLKKEMKYGPVSMFDHLVGYLGFVPAEAAAKVKRFYTAFSVSRHKAAVLTPGLYATLSGADDQRSDQRPLLFSLSYQFQVIDAKVKALAGQ